jgi:hypothetical protein
MKRFDIAPCGFIKRAALQHSVVLFVEDLARTEEAAKESATVPLPKVALLTLRTLACVLHPAIEIHFNVGHPTFHEGAGLRAEGGSIHARELNRGPFRGAD